LKQHHRRKLKKEEWNAVKKVAFRYWKVLGERTNSLLEATSPLAPLQWTPWGSCSNIEQENQQTNGEVSVFNFLKWNSTFSKGLYSFCKMKTHTFFLRISFWELMDASNFDVKMCAPLWNSTCGASFFSLTTCAQYPSFFEKKDFFLFLMLLLSWTDLLFYE
jgi:hypothetical protein